MGIAVHCRCGKKFKVKERLGGKTVRCPKCKEPLRIPEAKDRSASSTASDEKQKSHSKAPKTDKEAAVLRFERAQERKQLSAEAQAEYRKEQDKLIESYDQLTGTYKKGKKRNHERAGTKRRKPTIFMLLADAWATIRSTLVFRYLFIIVLLAGGTLGSIYGVQALWSYSHEETTAAAPREVQQEELFKKAEAAIAAKKWGEARDALNKLILLNPLLEKNRHYRELRKQLEEGFEED